MSLDFAAIYSALYSRAKTDSAGSALRALLGSGASSIMPADNMGNTSGVVLPWLLWRQRPVSGPSGGMRDIAAWWYAYVAPNKGDYDLNRIASAVNALYSGENALALAFGRLEVTMVNAPYTDPALGLRGVEIRIGYRRLG